MWFYGGSVYKEESCSSLRHGGRFEFGKDRNVKKSVEKENGKTDGNDTKQQPQKGLLGY